MKILLYLRYTYMNGKVPEKIKLNVITFPMRVDTESNVTLTPIIFRKRMDKPKLKESWLKLRQFDGLFIKASDSWEETFEIDTRIKRHNTEGIIILRFCGESNE